MSKSRVAPNTYLFQIVVRDHSHRQPAPKDLYVDRSGNGFREIVDYIPLRTVFKWAKDGKRAKEKAKKYGEVINCHKIDSQYRRLEMIEHLNIDQKPIHVDISLEEFTVGRDLEVVIDKNEKNIEVENT